MSILRRWRISEITVLSCGMLLLTASAALSQSSTGADNTGVVPDDMLTLVVGTRFVAATAEGMTATAQFRDARIPLSAFNETDHCIDQSALEVATDYFNTLGRLLGKAGNYYFVPDDAVKKSVLMCEKMHSRAPAAWVENKTKVIAFGRVVPTSDAPKLEKSIR